MAEEVVVFVEVPSGSRDKYELDEELGAVERGVDLIVLGHRGHLPRDHVLGPTADRVAEHAECPVTIVR